jgi:uncharacterized protein (TIGR03437 family)
MRTHGRAAALVLGWALTVSSAGAYYHFIHYTSKTAPYLPVPAKFDLAALPNKTLTIFVSATGPQQLPPNDSFASILAQVRQATRAWDGVATSDLRVAFGGVYADGTAQTTPSVEVIFDSELPPGLLAFTSPMQASDMVTRPDGSFFPITQSVIHLNSDMTQRPGPSYTDAFYMTVVHEMGHSLGLQHTFTSSVMSTAVTRATSAVRPLDADDIAAVSLLYPRNLAARTGTITGTVTAGGQGVHMASVMAVRPGGSAVSALTNPDGTYRIDGIPPGTYFICVQPLPPTADIRSPKDPDGNDVDPDGPFDGTFYPGTSDMTKATTIAVRAGAETDGIDFSVHPRGSVPVYDVSTYSYFGQTQNAVHPAYVNLTSGSATIAAAGVGLGANGHAAAGLGASVIGSAIIPASGVRGYGTTPTYLALDLKFALGASSGPQHFVFSQGSDLYVLPAALQLVNTDPPSISSVDTDQNGNVVVTGSNFASDSQVYFDGLPAATSVADSSHATAIPPPGMNGQTALVTVFNSDGQNSMFLGPTPAPTYTYPTGAAAPKAAFSPNTLPAGARALIDISGANMSFANGLTSVGFGSSDVLVRRVWVLSPTHALVNVQVASNAQPGSSSASVMSGFQVFSQPAAFQITAGDPNLPVVEPTLINAVWLPSGAFPGSIVSLFGLNLAAPNQGGATTILTINDQPVKILYASPLQINLVVPASLKPGPAILRLNNGTAQAYPVVVSIDPVPPSITAVQDLSNSNLGPNNPAQPGDVLNLLVSGLADPGSAIAPGRVHVKVGGHDTPAGSVTPANGPAYTVQFKLDASVATGAQVPLTISIDGKISLPVYIPITPLPSSSGN